MALKRHVLVFNCICRGYIRGSDLQLEHLLCSLGLLRGYLHPGGTALSQLLQLQLEALLLLLINLQQTQTNRVKFTHSPSFKF